MKPARRRKLLIATLFLALLALWDTTLGPDAGYWGIRITRRDPAPFPPSIRKPGTMRVLFIGNSFTRYWGGQVLIGTKLAMSSPNWRDLPPPIYEQSTSNGATLKDHWINGKAVARIREGNWDYVVLQDHSEGPTLQKNDFIKYATLLDQEIKKAGARTLLFMTWPKAREPAKLAELAVAYEDLGRALGAQVIPIGRAFHESLIEKPSLNLYDADGKHPSAAGSYLAACCFYTTFYGKPPTYLDRIIQDERGKQWLAITESEALFLQDLAFRTITAYNAPLPTRPATHPATQLTTNPARKHKRP